MQRAIAIYLTREMAILGLVEAVLSFTAIYTVVTLPGAAAALPAFTYSLSRDNFGRAAVLTLAAGAVGLMIGLYRTDVCLDRKRLVTTTGLAAAFAFAFLL